MLTEFGIDLRETTEEDKNLPRYSYSALSTYENCMLQGKLKYIDKNFSQKSSLAMEIGSILHKGLEMKANCLMEDRETDYEEIRNVVMNGCDEITEKSKSHILGVNELKRKYFEEWLEPDSNGKTYNEKLEVYFQDVLPTRMESVFWEPIGCEVPFDFVYDNRIRLTGFIDRVDRETATEKLKVVDYKSSKKVFDAAHIKSPLQMWVYACACYVMYGEFPSEYEYDFVLLNKRQMSPNICTRGWEKRCIKKVDKLLNSIDEAKEKDIFPPKPSPLCYWCLFHSDSPNADPKFKGMCPYHSLWTPQNKNFGVLNPWDPEKKPEVKKKRELIF